MKILNPIPYFKSGDEIIRYAIWFYHQFFLGLRHIVSYEHHQIDSRFNQDGCLSQQRQSFRAFRDSALTDERGLLRLIDS